MPIEIAGIPLDRLLFNQLNHTIVSEALPQSGPLNLRGAVEILQNPTPRPASDWPQRGPPEVFATFPREGTF
jgi:hypothetical protein